MEWVRVNTGLLGRYEVASLPDAVWRVYLELDLLCGAEGGPVPEASVSWALRKDCSGPLAELVRRGLVSPQEGTLITHDWQERNGAYLHKLNYNRNRRAPREPEINGERRSEEEQVDGADVQRVLEALQAEGVAEQVVRRVVGRLTEGLSFEETFPEPPRGADPELQSWGQEEWRGWAGANRVIYNAPPDIQEASFYLASLVGFVPSGRGWLAAVHELLSACANDMDLLKEALTAAARDSHRLTFRGPRSFISYARSISARRKLDAQAALPGLLDLDQPRVGQTVEV